MISEIRDLVAAMPDIIGINRMYQEIVSTFRGFNRLCFNPQPTFVLSSSGFNPHVFSHFALPKIQWFIVHFSVTHTVISFVLLIQWDPCLQIKSSNNPSWFCASKILYFQFLPVKSYSFPCTISSMFCC